jgi:hypothetical protein
MNSNVSDLQRLLSNPLQRRALVLVASAFVAGCVTSFIVLAGSGTAATPSTVALTKMDTRALERFTSASLRSATVVATQGSQSFYRISNADGPDCYGVGPSEVTLYRLGQIGCAPNFPSMEQPVLDFTALRGDPNGHGAVVVKSDGFASDDVADVVFQDLAGNIVAVMPVKDNVYSLSGSLDAPVARLTARDAAGAFIWSEPLVAAAAVR